MIPIAVILIALVLFGADIEVLDDRGVRRGGDAVKALPLGVRPALIGRPWIFGWAADGERGVREVRSSSARAPTTRSKRLATNQPTN